MRASRGRELIGKYYGQVEAELLEYAGHLARESSDPALSAADVLQNALVIATRKGHEFRGQRAFDLLLWLKSIMHLEFRNTLRTERRGRRSRLRLVRPRPGSTESLHLIPSSRPGPVEETSRRELRDWVSRAISELSDAERDLVSLVYCRGLSVREATCRLALGPSHAYRILARVRRRIAGVLQHLDLAP